MPFCEAHGELVLLTCWLERPDISAAGGTTYLAVAALHLIPDKLRAGADVLTPAERAQTVRWLVQNQELSGGFRGRTEKEADACYCFWCGAALEVRFNGMCFYRDFNRTRFWA
jgi:prenyltransferase beta subunit